MSRDGYLRGAVLMLIVLGRWRLVGAQELPEGEPRAVEASAVVPLNAETALSIVGIEGRIVVSSRDERQLTFESRLPGPNGADIPVAIWREGSKLIVAPPRGQAAGARVLRVEVPRNLSVTIETSHAAVGIDSVDGNITLRGTDVTADVNTCGGTLEAELRGGSLGVARSGSATLRLHKTSLKLRDMSGTVNVNAQGKDVSAWNLFGDSQIDAENCAVTIQGAAGPVHLKARQGTAALKGLEAGGNFELTGTPLRLDDGRGDITVRSDASVTFTNMAASLRLEMNGGTLRGKESLGLLEVQANNTDINLESIQQGMRLLGDGFHAKLLEVQGDLFIEATRSDIAIEKPAKVELRIDGGSLTIQEAKGPVQATVSRTDPHLLNGLAPVQLDLDGGNAELSWISLPGNFDSKIVNTSGSVTVRVPANGACGFEAKSTGGHVDSEIASLTVSEDRRTAQGSLNEGTRPVIHIVADGDIHLLRASWNQDLN